MSLRVGIDIGGTFTDFALINSADGKAWSHKTLTTPDDPSRAVVEGLRDLLGIHALRFEDIEIVSHGTTLVTNAVIERRGAKVGMLVTDGFADIVDIARETRYDLFDLRLKFAEPMVPRQWRIEVDERIAADGTVEKAADPAGYIARVRELVTREGIESLAICFLNSYRNAANELAAAEEIAKAFPDIYVSVSSRIANSIKEYERWTTTIVNAYTQPLIDKYLSRLERGLMDLGFAGKIRIMTSSGGSFGTNLARQMPVRLIESGPAAGVLMASEIASGESLPEILAFDMGGTTAKGAFIRDAKPIRKYNIEVARVHNFKPGSGLPVQVPVVDMIEIGAGGGSIAAVDRRGLVSVGPRSASAMPGPACYGQGGKLPTLTDAHVALGYLDPAYFLGGHMQLDTQAALAAIKSEISVKVGGDNSFAAASGIREIAAEDVAAAFRTHAAELGLDVRRSTMVAFGGSGPLIATLVARKLHLRNVLFPGGSGVFSAIGLLVSPASFETFRTMRSRLDKLSDAQVDELFGSLAGEAEEALNSMGVASREIAFERLLDMRYVGQGYQVRIELPATPGAVGWQAIARARFEEAYKATFSITMPGTPIEITDWRIVASERLSRTRGGIPLQPSRNKPRAAESGDGEIWYGEKAIPCRKVNRYALKVGDRIVGPALVQEAESTCVLLPGDVGTVTAGGHIQVAIAA